MEANKKEYGGCLGTLLPLWLIGQVLTIIYNIVILTSNIDFSYVPILLILTNIMGLIAILYLMKYKKVGLYLIIASQLITITIASVFPDEVRDGSVFRAVFGLGLILLLLFMRNKESRLNGYQILGFGTGRSKSSETSDGLDNVILDENRSSIVYSNEGVNNGSDLTDSDHAKQQTAGLDTAISKPESQTRKDTYVQDVIEDASETDNENLQKKHVERPTKRNAYNAKIGVLFIFLFIIATALIGYFTLWNGHKDIESVYKEAKALAEEEKFQEAIRLLEDIQDDYVPAKSLLGYILSREDVLHSDVKRGLELLQEAVISNDTMAFYALSGYYANNGDLEKSYNYMNKAKENGSTRIYRIFAWLHWLKKINGEKNPYFDANKALYYAELGFAKDKRALYCFILGDIYSHATETYDDVKIDYDKAFYWFKKGAELGDGDCYSNLGWMYFYGYGVKENNQKAFLSFKKAIAINKNDGYSYRYLGTMFKDGYYVKQNNDSAIFYYKKAAENGDAEATIALENEFN